MEVYSGRGRGVWEGWRCVGGIECGWRGEGCGGRGEGCGGRGGV